MNALVTLLVPPFLDLTYALPAAFPASFWQEGLRVAVPLGRGPLRAGIVRAVDVAAPEGVQLRTLVWPLELEPLLDRQLVQLLEAVADRQCLAHGAAMAQLLPLVKDLGVTVHRSAARGKRAARYTLRQIAGLPEPEKAALASDLLAGRARLVAPRQDAAASERCQLLVSPPWPVRPAAVRQTRALEYLMFHGTTNRRALIRELGEGSAQVLDALVRQGLVGLESDEDDERQEALNEALLAPVQAPTFSLNADQQAAVQEVTGLIGKGGFAHRLLFGVTGSGKTAVYTACARYCLKQGKSVLILAPEVALAHKLRKDLCAALPEACHVFYHGYQSQSRREATFRSMAGSRGPLLIVGTRSALFLPLASLGLIVLDEEHDGSFKQEERVPYQAKEVAWLKARQAGAVLLLGSATPDIKTWHAACTGSLPVLRLPHRIGHRTLPPVELVNMGRRKIMAAEDTLLAPESLAALDATVARGEQAIVLLNRRGFAPLIYCPDCKITLSCPNCAVGLAFHRDENRLVCHYCGYSMPFPAPCPHCHNMNFLPMGEGTERTADYLCARFGREVLRFDRDSTRRQGAMEELLGRFARHEANILVGTQMLSKGHHFPDVTLAIVADGDLGLSLPDYRAAERTFQLLVQSAGRAGRGEKPGRVLIQTRDVNHYCWKYVQSADYEGFYAEELERRRKFRFPPFTHVSMLRFSYERNDVAGSAAMQETEGWLRVAARERELPILGPVQSPIPVINNRMRYQCLFKTPDWGRVRQLYRDLCRQKCTEKLKISLNLDPYTML